MESYFDFLIKYNLVNKKFILDFKEIMCDDYMERQDEFLINSDKLIKWLKIKNRRVFHDTIKESYTINKHYTITHPKVKKGSGGHNLEIITLTPASVKKICMMTKSEIGGKVRQYFIDVEKALYRYKNYIIEQMRERIKTLERNQAPKIKNNKKIIYVFKCHDTNMTLHKLGKTIKSMKRYNDHNSPFGDNIEILYEFETNNIDQVELCVKAAMKTRQYRKYKEIYQVDLKIIKETIKECDCLITKFQKKIEKQKGGKCPTNEIYMLIPDN